MDKQTYYLDLSKDDRRVLEENGIDVGSVLRDAGIEAKVTSGDSPFASAGGSVDKEPVTIILATGASAYLIGAAIAKVLRAIHGRPVVARRSRVVPVLDGDGSVALDGHGRPILMREDWEEIVVPEPRGSAEELSVEGGGFVIGFKSAEGGAESVQ